MLSPEQKLIRAAMSFGAWQERANATKTTADRIQFVHAETALLSAAQALHKAVQKERPRGKTRRNKS